MNLTFKTRVHDGIIGALNMASIAAAYYLKMPEILLVTVVISAFMISSFFTGFCPLYFILDKVMKTK